MPGISSKIASHRLSVNPSFPLVCQKKKSVRGDRQKAIAEEVDKLMSAGFIWEVTYPEWLANVMMVKKANDKWKMCVDFTYLNKACPKDSYALTKIDRLVDLTTGTSFLAPWMHTSGIIKSPCIQLMKKRHPL
jgi:hypothetical protein